MKENYELMSLKDLVIRYFHLREMNYIENVVCAGEKIDILVKKPGEKSGLGVLIKDWKRVVGVDVIIKAERIVKTSNEIRSMMIVANFFSGPARLLAERIGIFLLLTRNELIRILTSEPLKSLDSDKKAKQDVLLL